MADRTVAVVSDSSGGLDPLVAAHFGVCVVPVRIITDGHTLADGAITHDEVATALKDGDPIRTEAPHRLALLTAFKDAEEAGATAIVAVVAGASLSEVVSAAESAAEDSPIPVTVVDSGSTSLALGLAALAAGAVSLEGGDAASVAQAARDVAESARMWFTVDSLKPLRRSGRAPELLESLGKLKQAKPIVEVTSHGAREADRVNGTATARKALLEKVEHAAAEMHQPVAAFGLAQGDPERKGLELAINGPVLRCRPPASLVVNLGPTLFTAVTVDMPDEFFTVYADLAEGVEELERSLALAS